jgi:hypothetical protein
MRPILPFALLLCSCVQPHRATRELEAQGFTGVTITGRGHCEENEDFGAAFEAQRDGERFAGSVCHEPFGADVVRFRRRQ